MYPRSHLRNSSWLIVLFLAVASILPSCSGEDRTFGSAGGGNTNQPSGGASGMAGKSGAAGASGGSASGGNAGADPQSGACIDATTRSCGGFGLLGTCATGISICKGGEWGACPEPAAHDTCEPSNDDDCDGTPNGGCDCTNGMTQPCGHEAKGICKKGTSTCTDSKWRACQGNIDPGLRNCSSADDNDCDGLPDNTIDAACACMVGASRACEEHTGKDGKGICRAGIQTCKISPDKSTSFWDACSGSVGPASKDSCDIVGSDDNCDGTGNGGCACVNGAKQACGHAAAGICKPGVQTCASQQWGSCVGNVEPTTRDCSSANDNDCDGKADNTIDGVCQCASGASQYCNTHPGKDGVGSCKAGSQTCTLATNKAFSSWGTCSGFVGPAAADTCASGNDANCNGTPNEGCTCINGATKTCDCGGSVTCANGSWPACPTTGTTGLGCNDKTYCDPASHKCWITADAVSYTQDGARLYCTGLTFQGSSDWTLPTRDELKTVTRGCNTGSFCPVGQGPGISSCYLPVEMKTCAVKWWTTDSAYVWYGDQGWWGMDIPTLSYNVRCVAPWPGH